MSDGPKSASSKYEATFCFVDLAGFTALTEAHGDEDAADVASRFAELTRGALGPSDCLIKTIGDAVLVTSPSAGDGIELVERLLQGAMNEPMFPALRVGMEQKGEECLKLGRELFPRSVLQADVLHETRIL